MGLATTIIDEFARLISTDGLASLLGIAIAAFIAISIVLNVLSQVFFKDPNKPPLVFHWIPWLGNTVAYGIDPYTFYDDCRNKYGDCFTFVMLGKRMTVYLGPEGNNFVFNSKLSDVCAEEAYTHLTTPVFGEGVVYDCPNALLMEQKKFVKFGLTIETFKQYVPLIKGEVVKYLNSSPFFQGDQGMGPLSKIIPEMILFTASRSLQGQEVRDALSATHADRFHDLDNGFTPVNFLFPWLPLPKNRRRDSAQKEMAKLYMDIIARRKNGKSGGGETDMIWNLMNRTYKSGKALSDRDVAHIMIALLMAGQHTSMATSSWILLHLAARPEIVEALYQEQIEHFGTELRPLTYEKISDLNMMGNVIKEILRIHPPLHTIIRKVKSPLHVPGSNYVVPSTHFLVAAPGVSAMDERHFKNAKRFDPYRWVGHEHDDDNAEKFDYGYGLVSKGTSSPYLPFGAGRHRCIGEQFANVQLRTIISVFVREFTLSLPAGQKTVPPVDYNSMVALPTSPSNICWKRRRPGTVCE